MMPDAIERFVYDDRIYYQQYRKCGRAGCKCQSGDMHGPYWYSKFEGGVGTKYVGKVLPAHVSTAWERYKKRALQIEKAASKQRMRLATLDRLMARGALTADELAMLRRRGIE